MSEEIVDKEKDRLRIFLGKIKILEERCEEVRRVLAECPEATPHEAVKHSAMTLETALLLVRLIRNVKNEIIRLDTKKDAAYGIAFSLVDKKENVSAAKAKASSDSAYLRANAELAIMENNKDYFIGMHDICMNAHKFYKSQMKDND